MMSARGSVVPARSLPGYFTALLFSAQCLADTVQIPLEMDRSFIESLLLAQVFTGSGDSIRLNDDRTGCQYLALRQPHVGVRDGRVTLRTNAEARAGTLVGDRCILILNWRGQLEFVQRAVLSKDGTSVLLRTESWRALTPDGHTDAVSTTIGQWLDRFLPPDLKETRISLIEPLSQLEELLALFIKDEDLGRTQALLDSINVADVAAENDRVVVTLSVRAPPPLPPAPSEPALSTAEVAQLKTRLDALDAFATYVVKYLGTSAEAASDMDALLGLLLELRHELITIVAEPKRRDQDPARALFVDTWTRLTPILREIAEHQTNHDSALRYLTFIGAGDMLSALDRLGPAAGVEVSTDGLRRLARILLPTDAHDPLHRDEDVDPQLRESFGFGAPIPPPRLAAEASWLNWFVEPAIAAEALDPSTVAKLNNWVPKSKDIDTYLPMVREVLRFTTTQQLQTKPLGPAFHEIFRNLVFAAAWQESCWRQFMAKDNMRVPLQSGSGDLGMMQINPRVWRGFYDLHGLKWDIVYNARAGTEILEHYLSKYAIAKREHKTTGNPDNLARSAYAAYNGGPRQFDRYRRNDSAGHGKQVDQLFYEKYRAIDRGTEMAVKACYSG